MSNLLVAIKNIAENSNVDLVKQYASLNRMNGMGVALETYVKDAFAGTFTAKEKEKNSAYSTVFSYLGSQNRPPDIMIRSGDAIEVKKYIGTRGNGIALNSSYPKDYLHSDSPLISAECRNCEEWETKDMIYAIGGVDEKRLRSLWFVYGNCYAADRETYERVRNSISEGVHSLPEIEFGETKELGRINSVDPLKITALRIRGMWQIQHPMHVFSYIDEVASSNEFSFNAVMLGSKYNSFPAKDRVELESLNNKGVRIHGIKIKNPNNAAAFLDAKLITISR